jgi:hypothetical protein
VNVSGQVGGWTSGMGGEGNTQEVVEGGGGVDRGRELGVLEL